MHCTQGTERVQRLLIQKEGFKVIVSLHYIHWTNGNFHNLKRKTGIIQDFKAENR